MELATALLKLIELFVGRTKMLKRKEKSVPTTLSDLMLGSKESKQIDLMRGLNLAFEEIAKNMKNLLL